MVTDRAGAELHVGDEVLLRAIVLAVHPEETDGDGLDVGVEIPGRRFVPISGRDCRLACAAAERGRVCHASVPIGDVAEMAARFPDVERAGI